MAAVAASVQTDGPYQSVALVHKIRPASAAVGLIYSRKGQLRMRHGRRLPSRRRSAQRPGSRGPRWHPWVRLAPGLPGPPGPPGSWAGRKGAGWRADDFLPHALEAFPATAAGFRALPPTAGHKGAESEGACRWGWRRG